MRPGTGFGLAFLLVGLVATGTAHARGIDTPPDCRFEEQLVVDQDTTEQRDVSDLLNAGLGLPFTLGTTTDVFQANGILYTIEITQDLSGSILTVHTVWSHTEVYEVCDEPVWKGMRR